MGSMGKVLIWMNSWIGTWHVATGHTWPPVAAILQIKREELRVTLARPTWPLFLRDQSVVHEGRDDVT
jgi:hypothetical protein